MIYSNDMPLLGALWPKAARFLKKGDPVRLTPGRYELGGGDYANVEEYACRDRFDSQYESHRDYVDIQTVLAGSEIVEVAAIRDLELAVPFEKGGDVAFYSNGVQGEAYLLEPGRFIALGPEDGHMPKLVAGGSGAAKKIVFKIRIRKADPVRIRYLVMDVDGTLTDGQLYYSSKGDALKAFSAKDGFGIKNLLSGLGISPAIITGRRSAMLERRCEELGISELHQGASDKLKVLKGLMGTWDCGPEEVAYIGDDVNDLGCMRFVRDGGGLVGCPADATEKVKAVSSFVSGRHGGYGAVREFIEWIGSGRVS